ncbi:MAG: hypothetical protein V4451_05890 [Pseudomonadota bacterium]
MSKAPPSKKSTVRNAIEKGLRGFVEVFKAGTHVDSKGRQVTFSRADVEQMVANHKLGAAPAVIGHPKDTAPAYAQVSEYKLDDENRLFAKFDKINPAFEAGVESGAYYNRSVSVVKDDKHGWRVRHVGWLGAVPPAIDGLQPVEFSADDETCFEFAAPGYSLVWGLESAAKLMRRLRDHLIEKETLAVADTVLPQWEIDSMNEAATTARAQFNDTPSLFNQPTGENDMNFTQADLDKARAEGRTEGETAGRESAAKDMVPRADFTAKETELANFKKADQKSRFDALINLWKGEGKIVPADEPGLREFMAQQEAAGVEFSFSKAEGVEEKKTASQFFLDFMASRKPVVKLGGGKTGQESDDTLDVNDSGAVAKAANEFMASEAKAGRTVGVAGAVQHVISTAQKTAE